jgi:hypothetical protein
MGADDDSYVEAHGNRRRLDGLRCRAGARGFVGFGLSGHSGQRVDVAERYGFEFALSTIKLRGFGGKSEFRDHDLESFALIASSLQHRRAHRPSTGGQLRTRRGLAFHAGAAIAQFGMAAVRATNAM